MYWCPIFFFLQKNCFARIYKLKFIKTDGWFCNDWNINSVMIFRFFIINFSFYLKNAIPKTVFPTIVINYLQWMMLWMQNVCLKDCNNKLFVDRLWIRSIHEKVRASQHKLWFLRVLGPRSTGGGAIRGSAGRHLEHG